LRAVGRGVKPHFQRLPVDGPNASEACIGEGLVWLSPDRREVVPLYERGLLRAGSVLTGPAIVFQLDATTVIEPGWQAVVDQLGNLNITR